MKLNPECGWTDPYKTLAEFSLPSILAGCMLVFKCGFCLLIAPVPVHCFSITFDKRRMHMRDTHDHTKIHMIVFFALF